MKKYRPFSSSFLYNIVPLLLVIIVFFLIIALPGIITNYEEMASAETQAENVSILPPTPQPTPTALPEDYPNVIRDYFENENETNGLVIGAGVLLMIIFIGVFVSKRNNEK